MGACELCGADNRPTKQAIATSVNVEACSTCIETMRLEVFESPFKAKLTRAKEGVLRPATTRRSKQDDMSLVSDFHVIIRNERISMGWTQKEMAMKLNERQNILQRIENGSRPTDELVVKLERILNITLQEEAGANYEQQLSTSGGREMTIADALEDFLTKGDGDD